MKGVNPQGTYRHRVPTLTLMGLALHGPAWAGGTHTHIYSNIPRSHNGGAHTMRLETNKAKAMTSPRSRNRVADVVARAKKWRIALFVPK
jgi:hypothetical protein